ncbi:MAG: 2-oxoacid:acceptor oxidoreductase family protein [Candidatus Heimdallarchaeota archaeon]|nr:2-oxoacid:acceptor oxidoreductase family protein [Candidatus Heimdallarchaeota archaeon]
MKVEILIAGSGGQGIILMGNIIGVAATLQGMYATQVKTYGSAQRSTPVHTEIVISDKPVKFAFSQKPDFFIAMSDQGFNKFSERRNKDTLVFLDSDRVKDVKMDDQGKHISLHASRIAKEIGNPIGANFVILGKFLSTTKIIPFKIVEEAIIQNTPEQFIKKNLEAMRKGNAI